MSDSATREAPSFPAAGLDRRFYAFAIDRLVAWTLGGLGVLAAYRLLISQDRVWGGISMIAACVLLVGLVLAVLLGVRGVSPGKAALGLRLVHLGTGTPIGVGPAMVRSLILGLAALPTFGLGVATLAWTAVMDRGGLRRGWHDHVTESIVVDVRPVPVVEEVVDTGPRHVVNLTAMRLVPADQPAPVVPPVRAPRPEPPTAPPTEPLPAGTQSGPPPGAFPTGTPLPTAPLPSRPPPPPRWRVTFDTGESFLVEGLGLVGRRPEARQGEAVRHLVPLPSGDMSLSKTHAQFQMAPDGVLVVMDRGSTNGSIVVRKGVSRELTPGKPATLLTGDLVRFGDRHMTVTRES